MRETRMTKNKDASPSQARDALRQIREAEVHARKIVEEAREKASAKIMSQAREEAKKIKNSTLAEARKKAEKTREAVVVKARQDAEKIGKEAEKEKTDLERWAGERMEDTVRHVAERLKRFLQGRSL